MTTKSVAAFFIRAEKDGELAERIAAIDAGDKDAWAAEVVRIARAEGFAFEPADIDAAVEEQNRLSRELGDEELESVSGGALKIYATFEGATQGTFQYEGWPSKWYMPET